MSITGARMLLIAGLAMMFSLAMPAPSRAQDAPADTRREQLLTEVTKLQAEVARLKKRIAELELENATLKQGGAGTKPGTNTPRPKDGAAAPELAPIPDEPLSAPEAALEAFRKDYRDKLGEPAMATPLERDKSLADAGRWSRSAKKYRGRIEWIIRVSGTTPDALKGGGAIKFNVVAPVGYKPYSDLQLTQTLTPAQFKAFADRPEQQLWKLVGMYTAEARAGREFESPDSTPLFVGPYAEMTTTLTVQTLLPVGPTATP